MKHVTIIGGGITGLITALKLYKDYKITIIDAGPDPKDNNHKQGATYSGLDARHISFTETAPWTTPHRHDLIMTDTRESGWLCIPKNDLNDFEKKWIGEFQKTTRDEAASQNKIHSYLNKDAAQGVVTQNNKRSYFGTLPKSTHDQNTADVIELNKHGIAGWEILQKEYDFINPVAETMEMPILCRNKSDLTDEYNFEHSLDERVKLNENAQLPDSVLPLQQHLKSLGNFGFFTVYGTAYHSKKLCIELIDFLKSQGVEFMWNNSISDIEEFELKDKQTDAIVWCSGVSASTTKLLNDFNILLGGVIGCWVTIVNPGISVPCKIYGPEPVNYINITPSGDNLLMSGGYGFVDARPYDEAVLLAKPIMDAMVEEVKKWFPDSVIRNSAYCVRPATPSGVPTMEMHYLKNKTPIIVAVGHAAGGFTQAPHTAEAVKKFLEQM